MNPENRTADEILSNPVIDHSSWHFFQAMSWLDLAKKTQTPSILQYSALELRYGIEYLLFELLVLASQGITEDQYKKCLGDPKAMKKALNSAEVEYEKLSEFTRIITSTSSLSPNFRNWKLSDLFRSWGIASELLHFVGAHKITHLKMRWFLKYLNRLEETLKPIWDICTKTTGVGLMSKKTMQPEVKDLWERFKKNSISEKEIKDEMRILNPILEHRYYNQKQ